MAIKEGNSRLLLEEDVIKAVDRHTNDDGTLDDDIGCILEEVKNALHTAIKFDEAMRDATKKESECIDNYIKSISKPTGVNFFGCAQDEEAISIITPRVFIFKTHEKNFMKVQEYFKKCIAEGCLVIPDDGEVFDFDWNIEEYQDKDLFAVFDNNDMLQMIQTLTKGLKIKLNSQYDY